MEGASNRAWLKPFLTRLKPIFREVLAMSLFVNLIALVTPVFTLQVYDRVVGTGGIATLWGLLVGMIFVVVFDMVLKQTRSKIMQTVALRIDVLVGRQLFDKLMSLPLNHLESKPANFWQSLFRDVDVVRNTLSGATALLACDLPFVFMFFALIIVIAKPLAFVLLVILPIFMFVAWRSASVMSAANQAERQSTQGRDALIAEMIQGRTTIKALSLDRSMRPYWEEAHAENIEQAMHRGSKTDLYSNLGQSLTMITTICLTSVGAYMIINQELTMGALIATNMLSGRLLGPLNQLVGQWRAYNSFLQSVDRLGEIFASPSERSESEVKLERPEGDIKAEAVTFSYNENTAPVVDTVSVHIKPCGIHALVGRNGSGKTTLLKILQGLYTPTNGRVLLDGADIAQFTRSELAKWMGYVPQECVLFQGTVRDNIIHRHPEASDDEIVYAATAAGVHHFIIDLPDGYATDIGEAGSRLSGGQRQRIAIARALLGDPAVLLLDEPSASLDRQAEQELRKTLVEISQHHTVVMVTHSPILLAACDELVALDKGKVALAGPSKEILPRLFGQAPGPQAAVAGDGGGDGAAKPRLPDAPPQAAAPGTAPAAAPPKPKLAPSAPQSAPPGAAKPAPPPPLPGQAATAPGPAAPAPAAAPAASAPSSAPPAKPQAVGAGPRPLAPAAAGAATTADPSVPTGDMFRLGDGKSPLLDDPYADLIDSAREKDRKSKSEEDEAMVEGKS